RDCIASANLLISTSASSDCYNAHENFSRRREEIREAATEFLGWPRIFPSSRHGAARKQPMVPPPLLERHQQIDPRQRETKRALHRPKQCDPAHDAISVMITPFSIGKSLHLSE